MLTLTIPHYSNNHLEAVLTGLSHSLRLMTNRKPWQRLSNQIGLVGRVRTLEVTYGENGWHPHFHLLLFTKSPLTGQTVRLLTSELLEQWQSACLSVGLPRPNHHGLTLESADGKISEYVSKWGMDHEMTKGHMKEGKKNGHYSPFALLGLHIEGNERAASLFREYASAFKGKNQLKWDSGLRKILCLGSELTDQELSEVEEEKSSLFANIPLNVWKVVLQKDKRGELLESCKGGLDSMYDFIINLDDFDESVPIMKEKRTNHINSVYLPF